MQALFPHPLVRMPAEEEIYVIGAALDFSAKQGIPRVGGEDVGSVAAQWVAVEFPPWAGVCGD